MLELELPSFKRMIFNKESVKKLINLELEFPSFKRMIFNKELYEQLFNFGAGAPE